MRTGHRRIDATLLEDDIVAEYTLPPLPYDYGALEPHIDAKTMEIHHDRHHKAYVDNLNKAVAGTEWADRKIEDLLLNLDKLPEKIRTAVRTIAIHQAVPALLVPE